MVGTPLLLKAIGTAALGCGIAVVVVRLLRTTTGFTDGNLVGLILSRTVGRSG